MKNKTAESNIRAPAGAPGVDAQASSLGYVRPEDYSRPGPAAASSLVMASAEASLASAVEGNPGMAGHEVGDAPDARKVNILLVDDQPSNLLALEAILGDLGQNLVKARSGMEALRCLLDKDFALILLDVHMPGMDGFETAALIRQREKSKCTPIIFLTAYETNELQVFKGYSAGAVDYICKPFVPTVLRSKVAVFVDIFRMTEQVKQQAELLLQLEHREHQRQLAEAKERWEAERLHEEIRIARQIQQKLFPAAPLPLAGFDISGASYPAEATGGDYFDYIPMPDGSLGVVIGDVAGHGFGPALLMAEARAYLRAFLLTHTDVGQIVTLMNQALASDVPVDRFATLMLARLDTRDRSFTYASAGHYPGYLLDGAGAVKARLSSTGIPLAVSADTNYGGAPPIVLEPGEIVLMLTDGIVEAHSADAELYGVNRALNTVGKNRTRPAREIIDTLYKAVREFCGAQVQLDDMTAIVIKVQSPS
jgi:phosphoserine phosphatase RsbU/P